MQLRNGFNMPCSFINRGDSSNSPHHPYNKKWATHRTNPVSGRARPSARTTSASVPLSSRPNRMERLPLLASFVPRVVARPISRTLPSITMWRRNTLGKQWVVLRVSNVADRPRTLLLSSLNLKQSSGETILNGRRFKEIWSTWSSFCAYSSVKSF